jgi:hypothetical protein
MKVFIVSAHDDYYPQPTWQQVRKVFNNEIAAENYFKYLRATTGCDHVTLDEFQLEDSFEDGN